MDEEILTPEDREAKFLQARLDETDKKIQKEVRRILGLNHQLSMEDKGFLHARLAYLTSDQIEEYSQELKDYENHVEDIANGVVTNIDPELEKTLRKLGVWQAYLDSLNVQPKQAVQNAPQKTQDVEDDLTFKSRPELEMILEGYGIKDASKKVYKNNGDLIKAIKALQA